MKILIDRIAKNIFQMRPDFISLESVQNIACVDRQKNKFE